MSVDLPTPIAIYVDAENRGDAEALAECFAEDAVVRDEDQGLWRLSVSSRSLARGRHTVTATAVDKHGGTASQRRNVRLCRG